MSDMPEVKRLVGVGRSNQLVRCLVF